MCGLIFAISIEMKKKRFFLKVLEPISLTMCVSTFYACISSMLTTNLNHVNSDVVGQVDMKMQAA